MSDKKLRDLSGNVLTMKNGRPTTMSMYDFEPDIWRDIDEDFAKEYIDRILRELDEDDGGDQDT